MGEDRGLWECAIYEHNITFLAGYDRGGSGRTRLLEERGATANDPAPTTTTLPKQPRRKLSKKKHGTQLDTVQEDIDIELEDMSEVRRGKQPER